MRYGLEHGLSGAPIDHQGLHLALDDEIGAAGVGQSSIGEVEHEWGAHTPLRIADDTDRPGKPDVHEGKPGIGM